MMVKFIIWLVVEPYPSEKYDFVSWDDEITNMWKNKKMFQTTNQMVYHHFPHSCHWVSPSDITTLTEQLL
jgi:hypothetical protein